MIIYFKLEKKRDASMPGSYAHITLVNLASEKMCLIGIVEIPQEVIKVRNLQMKFLDLNFY